MTSHKNALAILVSIILVFSACSRGYYPDKKAIKKIEKITKAQRKKIPKAAEKYFSGMQYIPGGKVTTGLVSHFFTRETDTTLLVPSLPVHDSVKAFFISDHEVTNAEYRAFIHWVRDSIAAKIIGGNYIITDENGNEKINWNEVSKIDYMAWEIKEMLKDIYIKTENSLYGYSHLDTAKLIYSYKAEEEWISVPVYPDTLIWVKEFTYSYNDPMAQTYFWHPGYNNYPILGVTWQQARAYCHWRSFQYNKIIKETAKKTGEKELYAEFNLPTEAEWEYAAKFPIINYVYDDNNISYSQNNRRIFPWDGLETHDRRYNSISTGPYRANFGAVNDENGFGIKNHTDDGGFYPLQCKSYEANSLKLYDMAGNVAEWTLNIPVPDSTIGTIAWFENHNSYFPGFKYVINKNKISLDSVMQKTKITANDNLHSAFFKIKLRQKYNLALAEKAGLLEEYKKPPGNNSQNIYYTWKDFIYGRKDLYGQHNKPEKGKKQLPNHIDTTSNYFAEYEANIEWNNIVIFDKNPSPRIVKGGSWANGPSYMQCGAREVFSQNKCSTRIGFRVVMKFYEAEK